MKTNDQPHPRPEESAMGASEGTGETAEHRLRCATTVGNAGAVKRQYLRPRLWIGRAIQANLRGLGYG